MLDNIYYFDTSIWIDIYNKRGYNGEIAAKLLKKIILQDELILYSDIVIIELKKLNFSNYEINQILSIAKPNNIKRVNSTKRQMEEAKMLAKQRGVPMRDALHAILSRDNLAQFISLDSDFEKLKDIIIAKKPEELI